MSENTVDLVLVLDRSGSMYSLTKDTIGTFNSFIDRERAKNRNTRVTLVLFDDTYQFVYFRKPIREVPRLTEEIYFVRGATALYDAIGKTICELNTEVNNDVIFITLSDGYENASREFNGRQISNLVSNHNWDFVFVGCDIDSFAQSRQIGIDASHTANFSKTSEGISELFNSFHMILDNSYLNKEFDASWKANLD